MLPAGSSYMKYYCNILSKIKNNKKKKIKYRDILGCDSSNFKENEDLNNMICECSYMPLSFFELFSLQKEKRKETFLGVQLFIIPKKKGDTHYLLQAYGFVSIKHNSSITQGFEASRRKFLGFQSMGILEKDRTKYKEKQGRNNKVQNFRNSLNRPRLDMRKLVNFWQENIGLD